MFYCIFLSSTDSDRHVWCLPAGTHLEPPQTHTNKIKMEEEIRGNSSRQRKPCHDQPRPAQMLFLNGSHLQEEAHGARARPRLPCPRTTAGFEAQRQQTHLKSLSTAHKRVSHAVCSLPALSSSFLNLFSADLQYLRFQQQHRQPVVPDGTSSLLDAQQTGLGSPLLHPASLCASCGRQQQQRISFLPGRARK